MKKKLISLTALLATVAIADNEIYVDQTGATANIDLEQLGSSNIIGGLDAVCWNNDTFRLRWWNYDFRHQSNW